MLLKTFVLLYTDLAVDMSYKNLHGKNSKKNIKNFETMGFIKITHEILKEILIAEIYTSHIPLLLKLEETNEENLIDMFWERSIKILKDRYKYFKNAKEVNEFSELIIDRYKEYFKSSQGNDFWTMEIAKILENRVRGSNGLLTINISGILVIMLEVLKNFIDDNFVKNLVEIK